MRISSFLGVSLGALMVAMCVTPALADPGAAPPQSQLAVDAPAAAGGGGASADESATVSEVVITGSHIRTTNFTSISPMAVLTGEQATLTGTADLTQVLQLSAAGASGPQVNNYSVGYAFQVGGPGANTLSLQGLGAQTTPFLLTGERLGPAGVGGAIGPIDMNAIPQTLNDHVDVLKDGASSIYGSDAVAGVVNIVTKTQEDGGDLHAFVNPSQGGGGNAYEINGSWGKTFDRGYITAGFDWYRQNALLLGERSYLSCGQNLVFDAATGARADLIDPSTGQPKCSNADFSGNAAEGDAINGVYIFGTTEHTNLSYISNPQATLGGGPLGWDLNGFQAVGYCIYGIYSACSTETAARATDALYPTTTALAAQETAISPDSRYTLSLFGGYDLAPPTLSSMARSCSISETPSRVVVNDLVTDEHWQRLRAGFRAGMEAGLPILFPQAVVPQVQPASQSVDYARAVIGVRGDLPSWGSFKNWTFDIYGQFSYDWGSYSERFVRTDRVNATAGSGALDNGCNVNAVTPGTAAGVANEPMAVAEPGVACMPVNYFAAVANGGFTPSETAFLYANETGHTTYSQAYIDGSMTGDFANLPAGSLRGALGFEVRRESIDDEPGPDFVEQNVYNDPSGEAGVTKGSEDIEEIYGELDVPFVKDLPMMQSLDANLSARFSNYSTFGSNITYKAAGAWRVNDWLTVRGTYGTAFRAPDLYERFLATSTSYSYLTCPPGFDPNNCVSNGILLPPNEVKINNVGGEGSVRPEKSVADYHRSHFLPYLRPCAVQRVSRLLQLPRS